MSTYGNLKYDFTFPASNPSGSLILIKSITASASASISFVNGSNGVVLDSTYKAYKFVYKNIHQQTDNVTFEFQASTNGGSSYGVTTTSTFFDAAHDEADANTALGYRTVNDLAQGTGYQDLTRGSGSDADENTSGELWLFNPSSTTYVKHFLSVNSNSWAASGVMNTYIAGYFNTTSAIDAIDFKFASGNIDDGTISLYGLA